MFLASTLYWLFYLAALTNCPTIPTSVTILILPMELSAWLSLALVCVIGAVSPGPSLAVILRHSIQGSVWHGIAGALSHGFGVGLYAVATLLGLSTLIIQVPMVYNVLVYGGAAYLCYMGIKALMAKGGNNTIDASQVAGPSINKSVVDAFLVAFLNPKLAVFFVALFSQFIDPDNLSFERASIMVTTVLTIDALWYTVVAILVGMSRKKLNLAAHGPVIDKIAGVVFIGLSVRIVLI